MKETNIKINNETASLWDKVAAKFGRVGPRYWDMFGSRLVELSNIGEEDVVLDIGCGRGASLLPAARKIGHKGRAIGIDISMEMIKETQKDIELYGYRNVSLIQGDGASLNFDDGYFNSVLCGFGIGFLLNNECKFRDVLRVLKPGGEAGFAVWAVQEDNRWISELIGKYLPLSPQDLKGKESTPNTPNRSEIKPERKQNFSTSEGVEEILIDAGFVNVRICEEETEVIYGDEEEWWQEMWANAVRGPLEKIESLGGGRLEELKEEAFQGLQSYKVNRGICFKRRVIYAYGNRPNESVK